MKSLKYISFLVVFFITILLQGCGENKNVAKETKQETVFQKTEKTEPILSAVHHSFDELAYLFNHQNDTTYVINFWATWCSPCVAELPYFEEINKAYKNEKVKVVLVSLDSKKSIENKLRPFIQKEKLMSHCVALTDIDYNAWIDKVNPDWDGAIPATIVYNKTEYEFIAGEFDTYQELNTIVKSYLKN